MNKPIDNIEKCPLCHNMSRLFCDDNIEIRLQCNFCKAIFTPSWNRLKPEAEKARYLEHCDDIYDEKFAKFVSPITESILNEFTVKDKGLDFGAGITPIISRILQENNYNVEKYDIYFHNFPKLLEIKYDYIACCEVIEHFYNPLKEFFLLKKILRQNGKLYCMTELYHEHIDFYNWRYRRDPSHVFIYHQETIFYIKEKFDFTDVSIDGRLIIFSN